MTRADGATGIEPTVFAIDKHGKHDRKTFAKSADLLPPQGKPIRLEQSTLQQGPLRHPDLVEWTGDGSLFGYSIVVSPRLHALLGLAALPSHRVFDALVQWPKNAHKKHGRGESPYFVYAFDQVQLLDALDLSATSLTCTVRLLSERMTTHTELPAGTAPTGAAAWERAKELCPEGQRPWVTPTALFEPEIDFSSPHFPLATSDVDMLFLDHSYDPWVSDGLRDALVALQATGLGFPESWDASRLVVPETEARSQRALAMKSYAAEHGGAPAIDPIFERDQERRLEVLARHDRVREKRGKAPDGPIEQLEDRLDVELPWEYRKALLEGELPTSGRFQFLAMKELQTLDDIDPNWTALSAPHAVRALIVAIDDGGDYLGYVLRPDSMTALDNALMHFHHETTAVTPSRFRLTAKVGKRDREE